MAWESTEGTTNSGAVEFQDAGGTKTRLTLSLEYQPEGLVEKVSDLLHVVSRQAEHDLKKFKAFIEHEGHATGAWRKSIPETEATRFGHHFDQTGGLVDFGGESDETADGETYSAAERKARSRDQGYIPPTPGVY
ncbi:MAG: cyclase [Pseudarthrobacter sp.]|nr:cyclase [Pseudarthrobacter sp.]